MTNNIAHFLSQMRECIPVIGRSLATIISDSKNILFKQECLNILGIESVDDVETAICMRLQGVTRVSEE